MDDFSALLQRFNAKERAWVIENAIGKSALSEAFRLRLSEALRLKDTIAPTAWWSIDYHIDWLFAALRCRALQVEWQNGSGVLIERDAGHYSYGIEDIDLVVCDGARVILIEAKAYGAWGSEQIRSKLRRLASLVELGAEQGIEFNFVLMSPRRPQKLSYVGWPSNWIYDGGPVWIPLNVPLKRGLAVNRCDETGKPDGKGSYYKITHAAVEQVASETPDR